VADPILVLRLSSLGDVVLTSSFLQSLDDHFPGAPVTFVVREDLAGVASALPGVQRLVTVPRQLGGGGLLDLGRRLAHEGYAHAFDLHRSLRTRLIGAALRGRLRPGFNKQEWPRFVLVHAHRDVYARSGGARPLRERYLEPLVRMGLSPRLHDTRLVLPSAARERAASIWRQAGWAADARVVGVAPGARWPSKCWPVDRFAALAARLQSDGRPVVVVGGAAERTVGGLVAHASGGLDLCGQLDVLETAAVLERCALLVTNDSGLLHVAEAVGRPVLAFFGPTAPQFGYTPYRAASRVLRAPPPCSPCSKNGSRPCFRPTHECMEAISVDTATAAVLSMLCAVAPAPA